MTNLKSDFISARKTIVNDLANLGYSPVVAILMSMVLSDLFWISANYETSNYQALVTRTCLPNVDYNHYLRMLVQEGYVDLKNKVVYALDSDGVKHTKLVSLSWPPQVYDYITGSLNEKSLQHTARLALISTSIN
jgi:hypothetical protein